MAAGEGQGASNVRASLNHPEGTGDLQRAELGFRLLNVDVKRKRADKAGKAVGSRII